MCPQKKSILESLGSGVNSLRDMTWETAAFEQQVRDTFSNFGSRVSTLVGPTANPIKEYALQHPILAFILGSFLLACSLPIIVFLTFAFITAAIGIVSFLFIEGTILSFAILILGSCLLTISLIGLTIGAGALAFFYAVKKGREFINLVLGRRSEKSVPHPAGKPTENGNGVATAPILTNGNTEDTTTIVKQE